MPQSSYLESKVMTAPSPRLHLMLVEGALRFGRLAEDALRRGDSIAATAPLLRAIDIVGEMLAGLRVNKTDLNKRLADLYWFVFRRISEAKINSDAAALSEGLRILEFERQTWQLVCEKFAGAANTGVASTPHSPAFTSTDARRNTAVSWEA